MDAARERLAARGCSVLVVCHAKPETLAKYLAKRSWHVPIVSDPERAVYSAFTLKRTGWLTFLRPDVMLGYMWGMLRGYLARVPYAGEDVLQLGGDFILDRDRKIVYTYTQSKPTGRPSPRKLLATLERIHPSPPPMSPERPPDAADR